MATEIKTRIKNKIASQETWESISSDYVLLSGEIAFVQGINGEMTALKVGNGSSPFSQLPYVESPALYSKQDILVGSCEYWRDLLSFVPKRGQIVIWSDRGKITKTSSTGEEKEFDVPGFKVGDGMAYNLDLPFSDEDIYTKLLEHMSSDSHLSSGERASWNHKITIGDLDDPDDDGVVGETLVISRN